MSGPQGSGESQYVIPIIPDLPGAVLVTSTKAELFAATAALRARRQVRREVPGGSTDGDD